MIRVVIRNPRTMPPADLRPRDLEVDGDGKPVSDHDGMAATYEVVARLVVAWHCYDATSLGFDAATGQPLDQPLLPLPATPELVAKLPMEIISRIGDEIQAAANPK